MNKKRCFICKKVVLKDEKWATSSINGKGRFHWECREIQTHVLCPDCYAKGFNYDSLTKVICKRCNGRGKILKEKR